MRSFTSNFSRFKGFFWAVLLLILIDAVLFRTKYLYALAPNSNLGQVFELEERLKQHNPKQVQFVLLGDSHMRDGLRPHVLQEELHLPKGTVFSLALSGGRPIEMYNLYMDHRHEMPRLSHVILNVSDLQLRENFFSDSKFRWYATLSDRLRYFGKEHADLTLGYFLKAFDLRSTWVNIVKQWGKLGETPAYALGLPPRSHIEKEEKQKENLERFGRDRMSQLPLDGLQMMYVRKLVEQLSDDGIPFTIVHFPIPETAYLAALGKQDDANGSNASETTGLPEGYAVFNRTLEQLAQANNGRFVFVPSMDNALFRDKNHLSEEGSRQLIREYGEQILYTFFEENRVARKK